MPETSFRVRWPDDTVTENYSPSTIVMRFLEPGRPYRVEEFLALSRSALDAAAARVQEVHGYRCPRAAATLAMLERQARLFAGTDTLTVLAFGA
jgi:uncharacterized repeat protein (TIGR04042 family)